MCLADVILAKWFKLKIPQRDGTRRCKQEQMKALHCIIFVATKKTSGTNILPPKIEELFSSVWLEYGPGNASLLTRYICNYTHRGTSTGQKLWPSKDPLESECNILNAKYQGDHSNTQHCQSGPGEERSPPPVPGVTWCALVTPGEGDYKCQIRSHLLRNSLNFEIYHLPLSCPSCPGNNDIQR